MDVQNTGLAAAVAQEAAAADRSTEARAWRYETRDLLPVLMRRIFDLREVDYRGKEQHQQEIEVRAGHLMVRACQDGAVPPGWTEVSIYDRSQLMKALMKAEETTDYPLATTPLAETHAAAKRLPRLADRLFGSPVTAMLGNSRPFDPDAFADGLADRFLLTAKHHDWRQPERVAGEMLVERERKAGSTGERRFEGVHVESWLMAAFSTGALHAASSRGLVRVHPDTPTEMLSYQITALGHERVVELEKAAAGG